MKKILMSLFATTAMLIGLSACNGELAQPPINSPWDDPKGDGTLENPFNVAAAVEKCIEIGSTASTDVYYVEGYVVEGSIDTNYGNADFMLSDKQDGAGTFTCYRIKDENNQKFTDANKVKIGDKILICGPLMNYKGNTPENGSGAYLVKVYGSESSDTPDTPSEGDLARGDGTATSPFNCAQAVEKAQETGQTATTESYYITGYASDVAIDTSYGNATFKMADSKGGTPVFTAFRVKDIDNQKFTDTGKIKDGDLVVIYAPIVNYMGNTPETNYGYVVSINDSGSSTTPDTPSTETAKGDGTAANPYNVVAALEVANANGSESTQEVYTEGYVISGSINMTYGTGTWVIADNAAGTGSTITVYACKDLGNVKFTSETAVKVGDKIVVCAPLINYKGNTPETSYGYLYSLNGKTAEGSTTPDTPTTPAEGTGTADSPLTPSQAIAVCQATGETATTDYYYVGGYVTKVTEISTDYGNATFEIADTAGGSPTFLVYRVKGIGGEKITDANLLKVGDYVVVKAQLVNYKGNTPETAQNSGEIVSIGATKAAKVRRYRK